MKRFGFKYFFATCLVFAIAGIVSCDTEQGIEDPDLSYFVKYYGGDGNQIGVDMLALDDGSFLLLGNSRNADNSDDDILLIRVNAEGDILWEKTFEQDIKNFTSA